MPCTSEKTAMDQAWNAIVNSGMNSVIYGAGGAVLIVAGVVVMGAAATGEGVTLGGATPAAGPVFAGGMGLAGTGVVSGMNALSHAAQGYANYQNYQSAKQAYDSCIAATIQFKPVPVP